MKNRVGETALNTQGLKMKIISYRNAKDIDVEFENGLIRTGICYANFKKGNVYGDSDYCKFKDVKDRIDREQVIDLINQGFNQRECSERIGVGRESLSRWMKANNINHKFKRYNDIKGKKFGKLTVIKEWGLDEYHKMKWLCRCDCGNEKVVVGTSLTKGITKSCGCLGSKNLKRYNESNGNLHGASTSSDAKIRRLASIYGGMKNRCLNHKAPDYKYYGGRGIKICEEWLDAEDGFDTFKNWALTNKYDDSLTIDRIDVNGDYEPSNCRWATRKQQANNTRKNSHININGETNTLAEWSELLGIRGTTLKKRYLKNNDFEYLTTKKNHSHTYVEINGIEKSISEWSEISGVNEKTIYQRYKKLKWGGEKLLKPSQKKG